MSLKEGTPYEPAVFLRPSTSLARASRSLTDALFAPFSVRYFTTLLFIFTHPPSLVTIYPLCIGNQASFPPLSLVLRLNVIVCDNNTLLILPWLVKYWLTHEVIMLQS